MNGERPRAVVLALAGALAFASACKNEPGNPARGGGGAAPSAPATASAVPAAPAAREKPWYSGAFAGAYQAKLAQVEVKVGAMREWTKDDGAEASGPGELELRITDDGLVTGTSAGPLGKSELSGKLENDALRVQLSATDASGFGGVLVATREGEGFKGTIHASSPDSLTVRQATVELSKKPN